MREFAYGAENLPDEPVCAAQRRVDLRPDADQPAGHRELQLVRLGVQRDDPRVDRLAAVPTRAVLRDDARSDLDLHPEAQDARQDRPARDAAFELVDLRAGLVYVEGPNHD